MSNKAEKAGLGKKGESMTVDYRLHSPEFVWFLGRLLEEAEKLPQVREMTAEQEALAMQNDKLHHHQKVAESHQTFRRKGNEPRDTLFDVIEVENHEVEVVSALRPLPVLHGLSVLPGDAEVRLETFKRNQNIRRFWRRMSETTVKGTELRTRTLVSVMRDKGVNAMVGELLSQSEIALAGAPLELTDKLPNGNLAWNVLDASGCLKGLRSISGLSLRQGVNIHAPLLQVVSPTERKITEDDDRNPDLLIQALERCGLPGYEINGWVNYLGPAYDMLIYGGDEVKGSASRASATRASEESLRGLGQESFVLVDLSDPSTIPTDAIEDWAGFLTQYVVAAHRNGIEVVIRPDGTWDTLTTWQKNIAPLSSEEKKKMFGAMFKSGQEKLDIDGEIWLTQETTRKYGIDLGGLQFRATEVLSDLGTDILNRLGIEWHSRAKKSFEDSVVWADEQLDLLVKKASNGEVELVGRGNTAKVPGIYKGAAFPRPFLRKNLMDIGAAKGRNKALLKALMKEGKPVSMKLAFGIVSGQEEEGQARIRKIEEDQRLQLEKRKQFKNKLQKRISFLGKTRGVLQLFRELAGAQSFSENNIACVAYILEAF